MATDKSLEKGGSGVPEPFSEFENVLDKEIEKVKKAAAGEKGSENGHSITEFAEDYLLEKAVKDAEEVVANAVTKPGDHSVTDYAEDYRIEKPVKEAEKVVANAITKPGDHSVTDYAEDYLMEKPVKDAEELVSAEGGEKVGVDSSSKDYADDYLIPVISYHKEDHEKKSDDGPDSKQRRESIKKIVAEEYVSEEVDIST